MYKDFLGVKDIENCIEEYFNRQDLQNRPYTIAGIALALDTTIKTLNEWENNTDSIKSISQEDKILLSAAIKKAKLKVLEYNNEFLYSKTQVAGTIFNLKNNFGWKDTQEITTNSTSKLDLTSISTEDLERLLEQERNK